MADSPKRVRRRLRVDDLPADRDTLELTGAPLQHLLVLRAAPGDRVYVFDGRGNECAATIQAIDDSSARVAMLDAVVTSAESPLDCWLIQALPARLPRMDSIVRQVTELGVSRIVPVVAERSQVRQATLAKKAQRWRRIVDGAAEQSHRQRLPQVDDPVPLSSLAWAELPERRLLLDPGAADAAWSSAAPGGVAVMVGPEGGWTSAEVDLAVDNGAEVVGLGPRILRADTAGAAAIAVLQHVLGDLR